MSPFSSIRKLAWGGIVLAGVVAPAAALADDVTVTTSFPSPYGQYDNLTLQDGVTAGTDATAAAAARCYGAVNVQGASAVSVDAPTAVGAYGGLVVDGGTLRVDTDCSYYQCGMYWVSVGKQARQAKAELDVAGPLSASQFNVAPAGVPQSLFLETQTNGTTTWGQVRGQDFFGWNSPNSRVRIPAQPKVVLNLNSGAPVLIGTDVLEQPIDPLRKLQVGNFNPVPLTLRAMGRWQPFSSRRFKKDIAPVAAEEYQRIRDQLGRLNVVRYRHLDEPSSQRRRLGFIAEEAPSEFVSEDRKGIALEQLSGYLLVAVKALEAENARLEQQVDMLEANRAAGRHGR